MFNSSTSRETSHYSSKSQTTFKIILPQKLLQENLTPNDKLVLAFTYSCGNYHGYNNYSINKMSKVLGMHRSSILRSIKFLKECNYIFRDDDGLKLYPELQSDYQNGWYNKLPPEVYSLRIASGPKILWSEYDSRSKHFGSRGYIQSRIGFSKKSITNWTNQLFELDLIHFLTIYTNQKFTKNVVRTCTLREIEENLSEPWK